MATHNPKHGGAQKIRTKEFKKKLSKNPKRLISVRSLLSQKQLRFCQLYVASEGRVPTQLYRRVFAEETQGKTSSHAYQMMQRLLHEDSVRAYIEELQLPTKEVARLVLAEQIHTETDPDIARRAAQQILNDDDTEQFRDSVERFWALTAEVGAEIEVPLPGRCQSERLVRCKCGEEMVVPCGAPHGARAPVAAFLKPHIDGSSRADA